MKTFAELRATRCSEKNKKIYVVSSRLHTWAYCKRASHVLMMGAKTFNRVVAERGLARPKKWKMKNGSVQGAKLLLPLRSLSIRA
jgi:hypothetical protein